MSTSPQGNIEPNAPPIRLDVQLHDLLVNQSPNRPPAVPVAEAGPQVLPVPVFPQHPELLDDANFNYQEELQGALKGKRKWTAPLVYRAMRGWLFPYVKSRVLPGDFHPVIA
jgi:hypothetical protein